MAVSGFFNWLGVTNDIISLLLIPISGWLTFQNQLKDNERRKLEKTLQEQSVGITNLISQLNSLREGMQETGTLASSINSKGMQAFKDKIIELDGQLAQIPYGSAYRWAAVALAPFLVVWLFVFTASEQSIGAGLFFFYVMALLASPFVSWVFNRTKRLRRRKVWNNSLELLRAEFNLHSFSFHESSMIQSWVSIFSFKAWNSASLLRWINEWSSQQSEVT